MLGQWGYRDICTSNCNLLAQIMAGSRINFEGLAFVSRAIWRKRTIGCCRQSPLSTPSTEYLIHFEEKKTDNLLTRDLMGGPLGPPGGFSSITQIQLGIAL